jgi:hypothetical protein
MTTKYHRAAEALSIPPRTAEQVCAALVAARKSGADAAVARLLLRYGRLTPEAQALVETYTRENTK